MRRGNLFVRITAAVAIWAVVVLIGFPLLWMVATAFKAPTEIFVRPPVLVPSAPTLENFTRVLKETRFSIYFLNSLIVATATTLIVLTVSTLGAHAMVSFKLRGRELVGQMLLLAYMLPTTAVLIPIY